MFTKERYPYSNIQRFAYGQSSDGDDTERWYKAIKSILDWWKVECSLTFLDIAEVIRNASMQSGKGGIPSYEPYYYKTRIQILESINNWCEQNISRKEDFDHDNLLWCLNNPVEVEWDKYRVDYLTEDIWHTISSIKLVSYNSSIPTRYQILITNTNIEIIYGLEEFSPHKENHPAYSRDFKELLCSLNALRIANGIEVEPRWQGATEYSIELYNDYDEKPFFNAYHFDGPGYDRGYEFGAGNLLATGSVFKTTFSVFEWLPDRLKELSRNY